MSTDDVSLLYVEVFKMWKELVAEAQAEDKKAPKELALPLAFILLSSEFSPLEIEHPWERARQIKLLWDGMRNVIDKGLKGEKHLRPKDEDLPLIAAILVMVAEIIRRKRG